MTLSLCMIVKNEEDVLERCLSSFKGLFNEIIIVDTGSSDSTKQIAHKFTNSIYDFKWINDFSAARNYSFSLAKSDFVMWLDADDVITPTELEKLKKLKDNLTSKTDVVMLKYAVAFDEQNNTTFSYYRERILNRSKNFVWEDPVHEVITPRGNIEYANIQIEHRKVKPTAEGRNLKIYEELINQKQPLKPRQMFYFARELYFNNKINRAIIMFKKFLKTSNGYKENYIEACLNLSKCHQINKNFSSAKQSLFNSFMFDTPRSEILCELGNIFMLEKNYNSAIYYFNLALNNKPNAQNGGFVLLDCYNFIPYVQLCVCHYNIKNFEQAKLYHNLAKKLKPNNLIILQNDKIFN